MIRSRLHELSIDILYARFGHNLPCHMLAARSESDFETYNVMLDVQFSRTYECLFIFHDFCAMIVESVSSQKLIGTLRSI